MTYTATISDFRNNLSDYIDMVNKKKGSVNITHGKKNEVVATLVAPRKEKFDWDGYMKFLKNFKPIFTDEDVKAIRDLRRRSRLRLKRLNW